MQYKLLVKVALGHWVFKCLINDSIPFLSFVDWKWNSTAWAAPFVSNYNRKIKRSFWNINADKKWKSFHNFKWDSIFTQVSELFHTQYLAHGSCPNFYMSPVLQQTSGVLNRSMSLSLPKAVRNPHWCWLTLILRASQVMTFLEFLQRTNLKADAVEFLIWLVQM